MYLTIKPREEKWPTTSIPGLPDSSTPCQQEPSHERHPQHEQFIKCLHAQFAELQYDDLDKALARMGGVIDVMRDDLMDIYEFAVEHARERRGQ